MRPRGDSEPMDTDQSSELRAVHPVLAARDVAESVVFLRRLGFEPAFLDSESNPRYAAIRRQGVELHLQWADPAQWASGIDRPVYRFPVTVVDALFRELVEAGCIDENVVGGGPYARPADTPWGPREPHLRDPAGNGLQFYRPR